MQKLPEKLRVKLDKRTSEGRLRKFLPQSDLVDFSSNDYLGFARDVQLFNNIHSYLLQNTNILNGSTGSRLLTGNHPLFEELEALLCREHKSEAALVFNSGYDANLGLFSSLVQKGDVVLFDEYIHASIRDGLRLSSAKAYKFKHNNINSLGRLLENHKDKAVVYVVSESVFSMDGDTPDLSTLSEICFKYNARLILDEAHAMGVFGRGLAQTLDLHNKVFARIITFGKALGCHGAAVLGGNSLKQYLINFARSIMYTTALTPHTAASVICTYKILSEAYGLGEVDKLHTNISFFKKEIARLGLGKFFIESTSAVQSIVLPNGNVRQISEALRNTGFDVRPILYPTVSEKSERLRFCIHSFNSTDEITEVLRRLATFAV